jgi:hypothetical protein
MKPLERRVKQLELLLDIRKLYFDIVQLKPQEDAEAEERRRKADEELAAAQAVWQARRAADKARLQAEDTARAALPRVESHVEPPASPPAAEPTPPPWTYETPPEMQIRPVFWRRSEPYDDGSEDNYGQTIHEYDPLEAEYEYDDDS